MRVKSKLALRLAAVGVVAGAAGLPIVGAASAGAVTAPALSASPSTGLTDGQSVTLTGTNYAASSTIYIVQCGAADADGCDTSTLVTTTSNASGGFTKAFPVKTGTVGDGTCAAGSTNCFIAATSSTDPSDTAAAASTPIAFAAPAGPTLTATPKTGLVNNKSVAVSGAGFADSAAYSLVQCSSLSETACDAATVVQGTTSATGTFSTHITVHTGTIGSGTCAATSSNCYLIATTDPDDPAAAGVLPISFSVPSTSTPKVTLSASKNLKNGQSIKVSGSGFPQKGATLYVVECSSLTKGSAYCDTSALAIGATSKTGTFSNLAFKVATGSAFTKSGAKGTCGPGSTCYVVASTSTTGVKADAGGAAFTIAKTVVKITKVHPSVGAHATKSGIAGTVKVKGKGFKGLKLVLVKESGQNGSIVKHGTSGKDGVFSFSESKAGKYVVGTVEKKVGHTEYVVAVSKTITIK